ncbi:MAG: hypothetical protein CM1200mP22_25750 [Dehalococcoidia bacterium]|nr:MAG: hypothetical protein CM1200mP22_25750 [Dehalococcoidia bacterium]
MEVFFNGERIFDKKGEGNIYPDLARVREMRKVIEPSSKPLSQHQPTIKL